ncbi:MAG: hypothetical protein U0Y82_01010 [Thermoleophilia bacterium]
MARRLRRRRSHRGGAHPVAPPRWPRLAGLVLLATPLLLLSYGAGH